jgi:hypothetical protein
MKRFLLLSLVGAILLNAVPALAEDGFYVIPTRATPGTSITSLPYTITAPGYYYLTRNLSYTGGDGITINPEVNNVTLDLMGFVLTGPGNNYSIGILISSWNYNVEVRNGTVTGWKVGVDGRYNGGGGTNLRAIGVRAVGNTYGITLGNNALIKDCTAAQGSFASGYYGLGILSGTISGCTVYNFTDPAVTSGSVYIGTGNGTASDNVVINCAAVGIRGFGPTTISNNAVINCGTGISNQGGGSIIGNAVQANAGQTGIAPATNTTPSATPSLLDQNSVNGNGTHYGPGNGATVKGLNGG